MLNDHTSVFTNDTHTHTVAQTHSTRVIYTVLILHSVSPLKAQFWDAATKRFIKTSKRMEHIISPAASVGEDLYGNLQLDFLCNFHSCVIFSNPIESAASCLFLFEQGSRWRRGAGACGWVRVVMKQLGTETKPPSSHSVHLFPSTPACFLPSMPLYSLLTVSLACQMVLEWIL